MSCSIDCTKLQTLTEIYGTVWDCNTCSRMFNSVETFLQNPLAVTNISKRNKLLEALRSQFKVTKTYRSVFACNVLRTNIHTPCQLKKCPWHISSSAHFNCLKCYVVKHDGDNITPEEFSWLYKVPYDKVNELYSYWIVDLQRSRLKQHLEDYVRWSFVPTTDVCCVCESLITEKPHHTEQGFAWCSDTCLFKKEPWVVKTESTYEASLCDVVTCAARSFKNYNLAQRTLGLTKFQMRIACNRYLGIHVRELFGLRKSNPPSDGSIKNTQFQNFQTLVASLKRYRKQNGIKLPVKLRKVAKQIEMLNGGFHA